MTTCSVTLNLSINGGNASFVDVARNASSLLFRPSSFFPVHALDFLQEVIVEELFCRCTDQRSQIEIKRCILQEVSVTMGSAADDKKSLPPPGIVNRNSVWLAGIGWFSAVLQNAINHRPPVKSG